MLKTKKSLLLLLIGALFGILIGFGIATLLPTPTNNTQQTFNLLAKSTQIDNPNEPRINFTSLRKSLESLVEKQNQESQNVSVYFEYLPTGTSIHINENNESIAASLMKVPVVMTLYQAAAEGKVDLEKKYPSNKNGSMTNTVLFTKKALGMS